MHGWHRVNHFQRLNKVKELKFSFSRNAQIHRSRHRAGDRCHVMPLRQQSRTTQARSARMTHQRCAQQTRQRCAQKTQQLYNRISLTSRAHRVSLSKRIKRACAVQLAQPPPPFFFRRFSAPVSQLRVSFPCICSPPVCIIRSVTSLSLATTT